MAENKKINTIEEYIAFIQSPHKEIIEGLRQIVKETLPEVQEKIMWSIPWYYIGKKPIAMIMSSTHHVGFGLAWGAHLKSDMLEGTGKNIRHIKIKLDGKVPIEEIQRLLKDSLPFTE